MPRRKKPIKQLVVSHEPIDFKDHSKLIAEITTFLNEYPLIQFTSAQIKQMSQPIAMANYDAKQLSLDLLISGKRTRPHTWRLDIFCFGLAKAWRNVGLNPVAWKWGDEKSTFLQFAEDLARRLGLEHVPASLINNVRRGLKIKRS
jgi:hypothetical protein